MTEPLDLEPIKAQWDIGEVIYLDKQGHPVASIDALIAEVERLRNAYYALDEIIDDLPSRAKYWREVVGHPAVRQ